MSGKIFINYRRDDTIATAGRLRDRLAKEYGRDSVFMDVDNIPVGVDFAKHIDSQFAACKLVISLIGRQWLSATDANGQRRIDNPQDYVRAELATALTKGITVVPVLVDGAIMPKESDLPESLAPLSRRNAIELRNTQFRWDANRLLDKLHEIGGAVPRRRLLALRALLFVALAVTATVCVAAYELGWFGLTPPGFRVPGGFDASEFRVNHHSGRLPRCDGSPSPEPVPINSRGLANLALLKQATASASSVLPGFPDRHQISFLNDGWYNNCRSWIAYSMPAWAMIDLGAVYEIVKVRFGSEHEAYWSDRAPLEFAIRVRGDPASEWRVVYEHGAGSPAVSKTQEFSFNAQQGRYVRIDVSSTNGGDQVRIDEIEVYGRRPR